MEGKRPWVLTQVVAGHRRSVSAQRAVKAEGSGWGGGRGGRGEQKGQRGEAPATGTVATARNRGA